MKTRSCTTRTSVLLYYCTPLDYVSSLLQPPLRYLKNVLVPDGSESDLPPEVPEDDLGGGGRRKEGGRIRITYISNDLGAVEVSRMRGGEGGGGMDVQVVAYVGITVG